MFHQDNLEIRVLQERDAEAFFEILEKNRDRLARWVPWLDLITHRPDATLFIQNALAGMERHMELTLGVWVEDHLAGTVGINNWNQLNQTAVLGYWRSEEYEGRHIMTQCCGTFCRYCFEHLGLNRIELRCALENIRSESIAKRLGFSFEGVSRQAECLSGVFVDQKVYALLKNEQHRLMHFKI